MAENFSDIMSNYQNMSVEELGTSLLSRQAQQQAEAAKAAKKNRKVEQALGVLLAGQAVFKGAFKRRQDELNELKTLDLLNVENDAKKIRGVADVMSVIPENYFPELSAEERTNKFFADRSLGNQLKNKVKPLVDAQLKSVYANTPNFSATPEYNSILDYGSRQVLLNIFKDNKHDKFYNDLQTLDPSTTSRDELFKSYLSISGQQLTQQKTRLYKEMENQLRNKSGLIGGVKGILQRISGDKEAQGELGLFSNITEKDIEGANLSEMLDSIDIVGTLMPSIDKAVSMTQLSPTRYRNSAMSQQNKPMRDRIGQIDFVDFMDDVAEDRVLDTFGLLSAVDTSKFEKLNKYFVRNTGEKESMVTDATALALRFQDDPQFAVDLYRTVTQDSKKIRQFSSQIRDVEFRNKFALAMTIKAGARPGWRAGASEYVGTDLYMKDLDSQGYDPTLGYNNMTALVEDPIIIDSDGNFKATKDYTQLSNNEKLNIVNKKVDSIINSPISQDAKQRTIDNLFNNIDVPEVKNQEEYFQDKKQKDEILRKEKYLTGKQREIYDMNLTRINNLQTDIEKGQITSIDFTGLRKIKEASPREIENMQNQITRLQISNEDLLNSPRGGINLLNQIRRKEDEVNSLNNRLPKLKQNLPPSMYEKEVIKLNTLKDELNELENQYQQIGISEDTDEKKKNLETNKIITSPINDDVIELQNKHLTQKNKDGTSRFTYNNIEEAQEKLNDLSSVLLYIESDGNFDAANPNDAGVVDEQSARGGYQFKPDSINPAIVRLERVMGPMPRFDIVKKTKDARDLSPEDQTLLVMADILEKTAVVNNESRPGYGDTLIQNYLDAETTKEKRDAVYEIYKILHHAGGKLPFKAKINTTRKLRKYFNEK